MKPSYENSNENSGMLYLKAINFMKPNTICGGYMPIKINKLKWQFFLIITNKC